MKGTGSPALYEKVKAIALKLGMEQTVEKKLKSGSIKFRFEKWDDIHA